MKLRFIKQIRETSVKAGRLFRSLYKTIQFVKIKRFLFWCEVFLVALMFSVGFIVVCSWIIASDSIGLGVVIIAGFIFELAKGILKSIPTQPDIIYLSVFWGGLYVWSLFYFSQTPREKALIKYIIPVSIIGIVLFAVAAVGLVMAGLASQGAGQ